MKSLCALAAGMVLTLLSLASGCGRDAPPPQRSAVQPWFVDATDAVRLDFTHDAGPIGDYFMPQVMGSGCALFDFDKDGRLDIYVLNNGGPASRSTCKLFRQLPDGTFKDASPGSGLDIAGHNMGVAVGDINNDGWPDVVVTQYLGVRLFLNKGDGTFADITREAGLDNPNWGTSASFVDYDRDGWLDLVVVNYVDFDRSRVCGHAGGKRDFCHPSMFPGSVTRLFRNLGRQPGAKSAAVRFQEVTMKSGVGRLPGPGLGVVCADFNGDGWPDIFVANDAAANRLWINQRDGTFKDEAVERGLAYNGMGQPQANMGVALGDVDGSGAFALFSTHLTEESHTLWKQRLNGQPGLFQDRTAQAGLSAPAWRGTGFGTVLADFDQDGALDLALANGRVSQGPSAAAPGLHEFWHPYAERNQLFANDGHGRFRDLSPANLPLCGTPNVARAMAFGDVDGDGAIDLLVTTIGGRARLYRNVAPERGHWLIVRTVDPALKRDAYGAVVTVEAGGRRWTRWLNPGSSYLSSSEPRAHFGLGEIKRVDALHVMWPDGTRESFPGGNADQAIELYKGKGTRAP